MPPKKTSLAILSVALMLGVLAKARVLKSVDFGAVLDFRPRDLPSAESPLKHPFRGRDIPGIADRKPGLLEDPARQLYPFFHSLELAAKKQGVAYVLHYGDSPTTADSITADLRQLLQERFGDAGHGFVLIAKPWPWYGHRGVDLKASGWKIEAASQNRAKDGIHGLGGVSFTGTVGSVSRIHMESPHARMEVAFERDPAGGTFAVSAGTAELGEVDTAGAPEPGFREFSLPDGTQDVTISVKSGVVRLFGVTFSKDGSGVVYDSLGVNGGQIQMVLRYYDKTQWTAQLQHRHPDLVVLNYGTNESGFASYIDTSYAKELREVIARVKAALPGTPILVMSPMDRGEKRSDGSIGTVSTIPKIVDIQRSAALETGCAFFNTYQAMGGEGTMARWYAMQPRLVSADFMHPLPQGARRVGVLLNDAISSAFDRYEAQRQPQQVTVKH